MDEPGRFRDATLEMPASFTAPDQFSLTSVQFKSEINGAFPCKRHQKRHLEFCTAHLRSRVSGVRISPGAPFPLNRIHSKGVTEIILHPCLNSDHLLF